MDSRQVIFMTSRTRKPANAKRTSKPKRQPSVDAVRASIVHPALIDAFDADWYYPWKLPDDARKEKCVQRAIKEGWAEWIETEEDLQAVRAGYVFDLSRDKQGQPIYWHKGQWMRYQGTGASRKLVAIYGNEESFVGYCGTGDHFCRFAESVMCHTKGEIQGKPYRFMHWQRKLVMTTFGWVNVVKNSDGNTVKHRRFREVLVEIPKKNAKSDLASIVAVYLVRADGVAKSYVYGCASDRKQAGIVYKESMNYVNASEFLREELQIVESKQKIVHIESGSFYEVVSADAYRNDGYDALGVIFDELHRQPNRKLLTVMKRSGRARPGKHLRFVTTTYGETLKGVWGEEHQKAKDQLAGRKSNYRRLVMIASAEPITVVATESAPAKATRIPVWRLEQPVECGQVLTFDLSTGGTVNVTLTARAKRFQSFIECQPLDRPLAEFSEAEANKEWRDDAAIRRANPSVDIVFPIEDIREDLRESVGPEAEAEAKQLSLNIISGGGRRAISGAVWQANGRHRVLMSSLLGQRCFGGGDFSFSNDLTAFWLAFPNWSHNVKYAKAVDPLIRLVGLVWVPEEGIENREEKEEIPYRAYAEAPYIGEFGYVRICPGASIDYAMVGRDIIEFCSRFKVQAIGFDPAFSQFIVEPYLLPAGLKCIVHRTGMLSMAPATKRFEELLLKKRLAHGNHPMLDHAVLGAMYRRDVQGNKMFCKDKSLTRIDPLASATMATGWACDPPVELKNSGAWSGKGTGAFG
jgi:phage terminase large subunit-like protein